jgi:DNA-binding CsgD family transcriptional regulator
MHDHPLIARYAQGSGHDVRVLSELPEASEFYHKPLYEEYFGKLGINDQLAVRTSSHDNTWGTGFSFSRSDCGFSTSEQRVAGDFGRDLRQAVALSEERLLNKLDEEVLQQLDDGYNRCVIAVDRHRLVRQVRGPLREIIMDHVRGLARGRSLPDAFIDEVATQAPLKLPRRRHRSTTHSVTELKAFTIRWLSITDNNDGLLIVEPSNDLLTQREEEVLRLAAEGKSTRQISRQLKIRECTVSNHFHNIHQKLGVGSTKEAIWITTAGAPGANASLSAHPTP